MWCRNTNVVEIRIKLGTMHLASNFTKSYVHVGTLCVLSVHVGPHVVLVHVRTSCSVGAC